MGKTIGGLSTTHLGWQHQQGTGNIAILGWTGDWRKASKRLTGDYRLGKTAGGLSTTHLERQRRNGIQKAVIFGWTGDAMKKGGNTIRKMV